MVFKVLSLGAGVQSSTVLLLSCHGELPKLHCAIFADTGWEPQAVYDHLAWLEGEAARHDIPVFRVSAGNILDDALRSQVRGTAAAGQRWASMPLHTLSSGGERGMIRRQCTREYKVDPQFAFMRKKLLGLAPRQRAPKTPVIEQWFGISRDELVRMRTSREAWRVNRYPLVYDVPMVRGECRQWFAERYPGRELPRSACIGCPYHSNDEWRHLRDHSPAEWREAVETDRALRNAGGLRGQIFLHRDCIPLDEVDLSTPADYGQTDLFANHCDGLCGV